MRTGSVRRMQAVILVATAGFGGCEPAAVVSYEAQWGEGEAWTVSTGPRQTVGVLDGAEEYQFVGVSAAAVQSDGDLVVADIGSRTVRLYDASGTHLKTLGGPGSGPGDFRQPTQILVHASDSIFVWDDAAFRITKFDPDGEFAGVQGFSLEEISRSVEPPHYPGSAWMLPGGDLLVRLIEKSGKDLPSADRFRNQIGVLRVSSDLSSVETVMLFGDVEDLVPGETAAGGAGGAADVSRAPPEVGAAVGLAHRFGIASVEGLV